VIKEIAHMVGDPIEVDDNFLRFEGKVRVKVLCKDAMKVDGNTLVYINGQGHLLRWCSEKLEEYKKQHPQDFKGSKSDKDEENSEEEEDNEEESGGSHDSGFARLGREQEEEDKRKKLGKASINSQNDDLEDVEAMDFDLSQSGIEVGQENQGEKKKSFDEEMIDDDSTLEKEKEEMKKIDKNLEEKTQKLA
jgi:predicted acylesterase/phospholipase RssA